MKTYATRAIDIKRKTHIIDAADQTLGRLSTRAAILLMGKHKPYFSHNEDTGDFVTIINAAKVHVTGSKAALKVYQRHTGYPGGFTETTYQQMMEKDPTLIIKHSINGMLPHSFLSASMKKRLRVYPGATYPDMPKPKVEGEAKPKKAKAVKAEPTPQAEAAAPAPKAEAEKPPASEEKPKEA